MQLRRRKGAVAVAVAVIAGALGGAPGAMAVPGPGGPGAPATSRDGEGTGSGSGSGDRASGAALPSVWPRPHSMESAGSPVTLGDDVVLVTAADDGRAAGGDVDPYALEALRAVLRDAGAR
ncbi:hypothetical protein JQK87_05715, partial [Streptomyces sp. G44]|nr:hypothetical protein [Streptomyces sp. G44]